MTSRWLAGLCALLVTLVAGCPSLTQCTADRDCEDGYGCHTDKSRCVKSCAGGAECPPGTACKDDHVCVDPVDLGGSSGRPPASGGGGSSSTSVYVPSSARPTSRPVTWTSSSSRPATSPAGGSSTGASTSGSGGVSAASSAAWLVDACNGADDDHDGALDEDTWAVDRATTNTLATDAPALMRVAAAPAAGGFVVAYSAYCLGSSSDVFVNAVRLNGTYVLPSGPCAEVAGRAALLSPSVRSRHPWLSSDGEHRAGLVWTEEVTSGAELYAAELLVNLTDTGNPVTVVDWVSVRPVFSLYGDTNAYGGVAVGSAQLVVGLTTGTSAADEKVHALPLTRPAAELVVNGDALVHASTEGEVAMATVPDGYVAAFTEDTTAYAQLLGPGAQPMGGNLFSLNRSPATPSEFIILPLEGNRAAVVWHENATAGEWRVRIGILAIPTRDFSVLSGFLATPAQRGYFGAAYAGNDELVVSSIATNGKLVLNRVNLHTGIPCGDAQVLDQDLDAGHSALAIKDGVLLAVWRKGGDSDTAQNKVQSVVIRRLRQ